MASPVSQELTDRQTDSLTCFAQEVGRIFLIHPDTGYILS